MSDIALARSSDEPAFSEHPRAFDTILYGGLVVGCWTFFTCITSA